MADDPEIDVRSYLNTQVASLTEGTNLFSGSVDESTAPNDVVFVQSVGGPPPLMTMGETGELRVALVNVFVRNRDWKTGRDLAKEILNAFNGLDAGPSGYEHTNVQVSFPTDLGRDDAGRAIFSVTVRLRWNKDTST